MKKLLVSMLLVCVLAIGSVGLAGCGDVEAASKYKQPPHTHVYKETKNTVAGDVTLPATCSAVGAQEWITITSYLCDCGAKFDTTVTESRPIAINANAHAYGDWKETTPATHFEVGEETRVCEYDDEHFETRTITKGEHVYTETVEYGDWYGCDYECLLIERKITREYLCECGVYYVSYEYEQMYEEMTDEYTGNHVGATSLQYGEWFVNHGSASNCSYGGYSYEVRYITVTCSCGATWVMEDGRLSQYPLNPDVHYNGCGHYFSNGNEIEGLTDDDRIVGTWYIISPYEDHTGAVGYVQILFTHLTEYGEFYSWIYINSPNTSPIYMDINQEPNLQSYWKYFDGYFTICDTVDGEYEWYGRFTYDFHWASVYSRAEKWYGDEGWVDYVLSLCYEQVE